MKLKIVYGVDMRLWKHAPFDDKPQPQTYQDLLTYIIKTFEFKDITDFLIKFKDDDDELTTISSLQDFQDAYVSYKQQDKKSLKLHIHDTIKPSIKTEQVQQSQQPQEADDEEKKSVAPDTDQPPIQSKYASSASTEEEGNANASEPSPEEINSFLSDDFVIDLLSDLFISVFEALEESSFEISFNECVQGIILSDHGKYDKLTSNKIWPYFCNQLLPKYSSKIEMFVIPMIRNNGINSQMIKQWIPTMLNMMKMHQQRKSDCNNNFGGFGAGFGGFPWRGHGHQGWMNGGHGHGRRGGRGRGGHGWRGRGWRHQHANNGNHGHGHGHNGWRGRGGRRGWRGHGHGHNGHNAWFNQQNQDNNGSAPASAASEQEVQPSAPVMEGVNDENEQMEQEQFEYTEELVAIMNMGFTNISKIKKLLNEHKGNKQTVVQELVSSKN